MTLQVLYLCFGFLFCILSTASMCRTHATTKRYLFVCCVSYFVSHFSLSLSLSPFSAFSDIISVAKPAELTIT